ncbi:very short patch repair endonuclease [Ralstonia flatus]|nr:DNA mismatch endonuclease Vsr [Ralstonia sp. LMG 32965]MBN6207598.1 DNA mismatch endonuclease Vsr [Ralstonia pickettii]
MDTISKAKRSEIMSRIRSTNTQPELVVRSMLHKLGYRFRLHRRELPGRPDIVLPRHRKVILVHGCFWHGHTCKLASRPKSNQRYWADKIARNQSRDAHAMDQLQVLGWEVLVLWECEIRALRGVQERIVAFMNQDAHALSRPLDV